MILLIDNNDSFTYILADYLQQVYPQKVLVLNQEEQQEIEHTLPNIRGLVISPGPGRPEQSKAYAALSYAYQHRIPVLGVCLGHQMIAHYHQAHIAYAPNPLHGYTSKITHKATGIFKDIPQHIAVMRYHSLIVEEKSLPQNMEVIARTSDNLVMAIQDKNFPCVGVQFHPESALTECGLTLLQNWIQEYCF